jgi:hypothetical protein
MMAHDFTVEQMVELVRAGLASATGERVVASATPRPQWKDPDDGECRA